MSRHILFAFVFVKTTIIYNKSITENPAVTPTCKSTWTDDLIWVKHLKIHKSVAKQIQWICMWAETTQRLV